MPAINWNIIVKCESSVTSMSYYDKCHNKNMTKS